MNRHLIRSTVAVDVEALADLHAAVQAGAAAVLRVSGAVAAFREAEGLTRRQLSDAIGIESLSVSVLASVEAGNRILTPAEAVAVLSWMRSVGEPDHPSAGMSAADLAEPI